MELQKLLSKARRAAEDYNMIEEGDKIAVGLSGGKDSVTLLQILATMRRFYPKKYEVVAISVDMGLGLDEKEVEAVKELCKQLDVEYIVEPTHIGEIVFDIRKEANPCSLCANMRRGALNNTAVKHGCNKVALGHHFDDVVETFMLNLFFEGRLGCFRPVTYLSRTGITLIRPMIYMPEKDIRYFASKAELPVIKSPCPADGNTERALMKTYLGDFDHRHRGLYKRLVGALERSGIDGWSE